MFLASSKVMPGNRAKRNRAGQKQQQDGRDDCEGQVRSGRMKK
jgi:hypothetical protein